MSVIYYGVTGEGRGHAMRARCIVDHFKQKHQFVLLASGDATPMLREAYQGCDNVEVREVRALRWQHDSQGRVAPWRTLFWGKWNQPHFMADARELALELQERADLVVSDFEVVTSYAARKAGVKLVTIDHQRFLVACDFRAAPFAMRIRAAIMGKAIGSNYPDGDLTIISSFYLPPFKPRYAHALGVGVLLRDDIQQAKPVVEPHLVVYLRKFCPPNVLEVLKQLPLSVHMYGVGKQSDEGNIFYHEIHAERFAEHLASSTALVTTAGNQLVGEALFLQKPVLAFPEPGNSEQLMNGVLLNQSGMGLALDYQSLTYQKLQDFLTKRDVHVARMDSSKIVGNQTVFKKLSQLLS